jgi:hypothetical protein
MVVDLLQEIAADSQNSAYCLLGLLAPYKPLILYGVLFKIKS